MKKEKKYIGRWILALALVSPAPFLQATDAVGKRSGPKTVASINSDATNQASHTDRYEQRPGAWQATARLKRSLGSTSGTLLIDEAGVEFRPTKGSSLRWPFVEIRTLDLEHRRVVVGGYERHGRLRPGTREYRFDLKADMPPQIAAALALRVGRPVRNGNPAPEAQSFASIPAHHGTHFGGSNGILRFRDEGVDYVTKGTNDGRSWRWADIQTITNQDSYHLIVFGYRETYSFDLKEPLPPGLYDRLTDEVYDHNVKDLRGSVKAQPEAGR